VDDIETEVADLRSRGVVFEEFPGRRFVDGDAVDGPFMAAWFRDSDGNVLNVRSKGNLARSCLTLVCSTSWNKNCLLSHIFGLLSYIFCEPSHRIQDS
jgi:hypothetical protein